VRDADSYKARQFGGKVVNRFWFQVSVYIVGAVAATLIADAMKDKLTAIQSNRQRVMP
jgi:hypothetical protein